MDKKSKSCCFIGHRLVENKDEIVECLYRNINNLILSEGVEEFYFGSRSEFDDICYGIVTEIKEKSPHIKRVFYMCRNEDGCLEKERESLERTVKKILKKEVKLKGYEKVVKSQRVCSAGKASYIERNRVMIDDSNFCIFYYNSYYNVDNGKSSGTKIAYEYALTKKKKGGRSFTVINVCK